MHDGTCSNEKGIAHAEGRIGVFDTGDMTFIVFGSSNMCLHEMPPVGEWWGEGSVERCSFP